ncbi:pilus assembly protein TadE [Novosphingobium sp. MMS21-SN21R]|uniref:TadE/TadG family type IV pilus assembly protein n=1 Tax=Novosphingobium sp. MMS21-SN21R TaxID=2969298 RepID=UPI002883E66D|nr:pilus assembly protein TadE [Novosphingobium sp. MMS21-SN21R]MDT0508605.1 pilus assembly protein TadE [Novosphingobium sp. MMS21-SN21R]
MLKRAGQIVRRLASCRSGVSVVEFALVMPVILSIGLYGVEIAYLNTVDMKLSEIALTLADNASRLGQTDNSAVTPTVTEDDVNEVMLGARAQGDTINIGTRGRIILTSLERDSATGKQFIHWQRCFGSLARQSAYGNATSRNGLNGAVITGLGSGPNKVTATSSSTAVMFVEVYYSYTGLVGDTFVSNRVIKKEGAYLIRDERNLTPGVTGTGGQYPC